MFEVKSPTVHRLTRYHPLFGLLVPLCLAPLASCADDVYLAQNYQTANPGYEQPTYSAAPSGYAAPVANGGQFLAPPQLAELVNRIALYPDDLIGIILPASTFPLQIVEAARYLDAVRGNSTLAPDDSWDNSVVALLNYPDVVNMMNHELEWTERLGQAVVVQQADVIAAIGQFRAQAQAAGNLRSDERQVVDYDEGAIRIRPANPQVIYVPQYEPTRVIVYQSEPVFGYYPRPCPVYYYNYASGYPSGFTNFWGVSTMFSIGWSSRSVHLHDYDYYDDPRFDRPYNGYFYRRGRHDWHDDDNDHRGHDNDRHDGRGGGDRPREHDWQPHGGKGTRPIAVGNGGQGHDRGDQGHEGGRGLGHGESRDGGSQGGNFTSPPVPRRTQTQDGDNRGRREVRPVVPQQNDASPLSQPGSAPRTPRIIETPDAPSTLGIRRGNGVQSDRGESRAQPDNPAARFSAPTPRPVDRDSNVPRFAPVQPRSMGAAPDADQTRGNGRLAPSRPDPRPVTPSRDDSRDTPSRQDARVIPNRPELRAPVANPRNSDGPASVRRPSNDDRNRGDRDR